MAATYSGWKPRSWSYGISSMSWGSVRQTDRSCGGWTAFCSSGFIAAALAFSMPLPSSGPRQWRVGIEWVCLLAMEVPSARRPPADRPEATRRAFNKRFLLDLAEDWQQHGREV